MIFYIVQSKKFNFMFTLIYAYAPPRHFLYTQASYFVKLFHGKSGESWRVETAGNYMLRFYKVIISVFQMLYKHRQQISD